MISLLFTRVFLWFALTSAISCGQDARDKRRKLDLVLIDGGGVVSDQINARNLLKHLINPRKDGAVEMPIFIPRKQVTNSYLRRFQNRFLDCSEFSEYKRIIGR